MTDRKQIGKILLRQRALTPDQLERALTENKGGRLASPGSGSCSRRWNFAGSGLARWSNQPKRDLGVCQLLLTAAIAWAAFMLGRSLPYWPIAPSCRTMWR